MINALGQIPMRLPQPPPGGPAPPGMPGMPQGSPPPEIRDIVQPEALPDYAQTLITAGLGLAALVMAGLLLWRYLRARRAAAPPPEPGTPPSERALAALRALQEKASSLSPNEIGVAASNILKNYFHELYDDPVLFETSEEFRSREALVKRIPRNKQTTLAEFFDRSDTVKYGKFPEASAQTGPLIELAVGIISE
ncbi:MAG: hypothetical protein ACC661_01775 [Verrucomicrobiales bacterium]